MTVLHIEHGCISENKIRTMFTTCVTSGSDLAGFNVGHRIRKTVHSTFLKCFIVKTFFFCFSDVLYCIGTSQRNPLKYNERYHCYRKKCEYVQKYKGFCKDLHLKDQHSPTIV